MGTTLFCDITDSDYSYIQYLICFQLLKSWNVTWEIVFYALLLTPCYSYVIEMFSSTSLIQLTNLWYIFCYGSLPCDLCYPTSLRLSIKYHTYKRVCYRFVQQFWSFNVYRWRKCSSLINKEKWKQSRHSRTVTHPTSRLVRDARPQNHYNTHLHISPMKYESRCWRSEELYWQATK